MCGITGFCDFRKKSNRDILVEMTDTLHHRGPNDSGYSFYDRKKYNIGLGHRRLSILDLSKHGHQPMSYQNIEVIFNGEIYNFKAIREELIEYGYLFTSNSDTEVILKAYHKWGVEAVNRFNGMFSIVFFDKESDNLKIIRDRAGVKPLFWYFKDGLLLFASELKSFHKHLDFKKDIDHNGLELYLQYGYILEPFTIFKNTHKLKGGYYLDINLKTEEIKDIKYWSILDSYSKPKLKIAQQEAVDETEKILTSSCNYRMVSDVPVGIFLSGGYDSSAVTAILQKNSSSRLNTFTIGFHEEVKNEATNEAEYAKEIASYLGTNHTEYYCTKEDAIKILPKLPYIYDEPFADRSAIPTILVSQLAKRDVTVALSADAGDEVFAGYKKYDTSLRYYNFFNKLPNFSQKIISKAIDKIDPKYIPYRKKIYNFNTRYEKIGNILENNSSNRAIKYLDQIFTYRELKTLLRKDINRDIKTNFDIDVSNFDDISKMLSIDYKTYLIDDILTKVDRATMSVSLEGREPLLDYNLAEFVAQLPSNLKYKDGEKKWILKEIVHKYIPKSMMDRPKAGFGVPLSIWFRDELREYFLYYLSEDRLTKESIFNVSEVINLRDGYLNNGNSLYFKKLWTILMFEMWYEEWIR